MKKSYVAVRLDEDMEKAFKRLAEDRDMDTSTLLRQLINKELKDDKSAIKIELNDTVLKSIAFITEMLLKLYGENLSKEESTELLERVDARVMKMKG
jgi:antitoxin component of RelBE/YafQ-DinJ toxin-antitoxin module